MDHNMPMFFNLEKETNKFKSNLEFKVLFDGIFIQFDNCKMYYEDEYINLFFIKENSNIKLNFNDISITGTILKISNKYYARFKLVSFDNSTNISVDKAELFSMTQTLSIDEKLKINTQTADVLNFKKETLEQYVDYNEWNELKDSYEKIIVEIDKKVFSININIRDRTSLYKAFKELDSYLVDYMIDNEIDEELKEKFKAFRTYIKQPEELVEEILSKNLSIIEVSRKVVLRLQTLKTPKYFEVIEEK